MRPLVLTILLALAIGPVAAMEIPFRDGSVVEAAGYTVTGSYVMIEMADGSRVAYDVADIDLDTLRQAEAEAAAAEAVDEAPAPATTLGVTGSLQVPDEGAGDSEGITITDQHVKHVRGSGIAGPEDETAEAPAGGGAAVPEGFQEGGKVLLNNVTVSPLEGGQWQVDGEVVNRSPETVLEVQAKLQTPLPEGQPMTATIPVSGILGPDEKASFSHTFGTPDGVEDGWTPSVQVSVIWMQGETKLEPQYNRNAPHPSNLPLERGGVTGAETRNDEIID
jgi:hypothetical protein